MMTRTPATSHSVLTTGCGCGCGSASACSASESGGMERTRFFPRQLVTPDDLTQDQLYFRDKELRHNRLLHGWGVVCGARVMQHPGDTCKVVVEAGYVLGPYGHEILIERDIEVDLCHEDVEGNAVSPCGGDPWCSDIRVSRQGGRPLYIAVKYAQCETRPVRAQGHSCNCDEVACEYSRIRDGFAIKVLSELPSSYSDPMAHPDVDGAVRCRIDDQEQVVARACPPCPSEPWVILADVLLGNDGSVEEIDCFAHRRYVASFADYYYLCAPRVSPDRLRAVDVLVDRRAEAAGEAAPSMLIALVRSDGSNAYLPVHYAVQPGETLGTLLAREGGREIVDSASGQAFTLADLYAMAGADPEATLTSLGEAVTPLQGTRIRVSDLRDVRDRLGSILDAEGTRRLAERHANAPAAVESLPATTIRGVSPTSTVGRRLAEMTVADVTRGSRDEFTASIAEGVPANQRQAVLSQAGAVWDNAAEAVRVTASWRRV